MVLLNLSADARELLKLFGKGELANKPKLPNYRASWFIYRFLS